MIRTRGGRADRRSRRCCGCARGAGTACAAGARTVGTVDDGWDRGRRRLRRPRGASPTRSPATDPTSVRRAPPELARRRGPAAARAPSPRTGRTHERTDGPAPAAATESATARLARLLTMVPWLVNRQGIDLAEAADELGVSDEQLEADLQLLFVCGYGQMPDELIEADWEGGRVFVGNADTIARPLRLGVDEARDPHRRAARPARRCRAWGSATPSSGRSPSSRQRDRRRAAAGARASRSPSTRAWQPSCWPTPARRSPSTAPAAPALPRAGRDEATERDVDPMRVVNIDAPLVPRGLVPPRRGHPALPDRPDRGARGARRRRHAAAAGAAARPRRRHLHAQRRRPAGHAAAASPGRPGSATTTRWSRSRSTSDGSQTVSLRTADTAWLRRLLWRLGGRGHACSSRPPSPRRCAAAPARPWRHTRPVDRLPLRRGRVVARVVVGADLDAARR